MRDMKARIIGLIAFGMLGLLLGSGTGIVGGVFGAVAGLFVFGAIGAVYGWSAGPDIAKFIVQFLRRK